MSTTLQRQQKGNAFSLMLCVIRTYKTNRRIISNTQWTAINKPMCRWSSNECALNAEGYKRCASTLGTETLLRLDSLSNVTRFQGSHVNVIPFVPTRNVRPYLRRHSRN